METLANKVQELRNNFLNYEITLAGGDYDLEKISDSDISGNYDLKRDLMHSEREGSYDAGEINFEFRFVDGSDVSWKGKIVITDIYEL